MTSTACQNPWGVYHVRPSSPHIPPCNAFRVIKSNDWQLSCKATGCLATGFRVAVSPYHYWQAPTKRACEQTQRRSKFSCGHLSLLKSPGPARLKHKRHLLRKRLAVSQPPFRLTASVSSGPAMFFLIDHQRARQGNSRPNWALNLTLCGGQALPFISLSVKASPPQSAG